MTPTHGLLTGDSPSHWCPNCHQPLSPVTPETTAASVDSYHCGNCNRAYQVLHAIAAGSNDILVSMWWRPGNDTTP